MMHIPNMKNSIYLIYDSKCVFCSSFVRNLELIADKKIVDPNYLYILPPTKLEILNKKTEINLDINTIETLKKLSKKTIILLCEKRVYIRSKALIKLFFVLRPNSIILKIFNKRLENILSIILDPFYVLFAMNRYFLSKIFSKLFPSLFKLNNDSCLISSKIIKFI